MKKVLITDKVHPLLIEGLRQDGFEVIFDTSCTTETLHNQIEELEGVIINSKILADRSLIQKGFHLKFIGRLGSGMEIIDIPYAQSQGIAVLNTPDGNCNAVAEHALGMLLSLNNQLLKADREVRNFHWDREGNRGVELMYKTVGIIGFGYTGSHFAKKLSAMGVRILCHDKYKHNFERDYHYLEESTLEQIKQDADYISFHLPLTDETKHYCDASFMSECKDGVVLLNTSRGQVIDTPALIGGLESGKIGGAALDVFENEKPARYTEEEKAMYQKLYDHDQVILSPHVAGWTVESLQRIAELMLHRIRAAYASEDS